MTAQEHRWKCKQCSHQNPDEEDFCDTCFAPRKASAAPRESCRTCGHRHSMGKHCHVFVINKKRWKRKTAKWNKPRQSAGDEGTNGDKGSSSSEGSSDDDSSEQGSSGKEEEEEGEEEDEEDEEEEDDSSENSSDSSGSEDEEGNPKRPKQGLLGLGDRLAAKAAAIAKTAGNATQAVTGGGRLRETPPYAAASCFKRCNCGDGVPTDSTAFVPLQDGRTLQHEAVGMVTVRTEPLEGADFEFENRPPLEQTPPPPHALRLFLEYMDSRTVARCARASSEWHRECSEINEEGLPVHPTYTGIHYMELESSFDACQDKIDGLFFHQPPSGNGGQLFTSGQRKVAVWRREEIKVGPLRDDQSTASEENESQKSGESSSVVCQAENSESTPKIKVSWKTPGVCVRDTAPFTMIRPVNNSIICCSTNGSIREWSVAHEVKNTRFLAQMWEHNGFITDVAFTAPSVGFCKAHSAPQHSCYMYSVSDDRYLKVWDLATKECLHTVKPRVSDCGTLQSVTKSDFHLYVGSSIGRIIVFALGRVCQRPEKHRCHLYDEPQWFCEQESFELGKDPVQHMVCGGIDGRYKYLFAGARDGTIQVWNVPKASFGHTKVCVFREHKRAITALSLTKAHLFSASDEGHVRVWSLGTLCLQRVVRQDWRIKCIWVHHAPPDSPDAGTGNLFLGLATGQVLSYPITDAV